MAREDRDAIVRAIVALPPKQRTALTLRDFVGATPEEACRRAQVTEGHQRVLLHRAHAKVRSAVTRDDDEANPAAGPGNRPVSHIATQAR